ncbi:MAG: WYL domain-containing protein [Tumebacillaceae bacterium]
MTGWGMKELEIALREHRPVALIYMDRQGAISQRVVQVTNLTEDGLHGYCYKRREPRTFRREQILAVSLQVPRSTPYAARSRRFG